VADAFLIVGIVMLMYHAWRMPDPSKQIAPDAPTDSDADSGSAQAKTE
jgi:hypothetical protein